VPTAILQLEWRDVDPVMHPFDAASASARLVECADTLGTG
jgi:hypothetical protein